LKRIGGQLFPEEENWCSNSFKRKEVVKQITGKTVIKVDKIKHKLLSVYLDNRFHTDNG